MPDPTPQPHSELASFGEELRREREIRGISLKEIADATKISKRFLEAIERNDHKTLPAPVFTRGFVREYARYLGLNSEEIVNRYNFAAVGDDRIEKTAHLERLTHPEPPAAPPKPLPKKDIPPAYARIDRNVFLTIFIVAALAGVSWWAIRNKRANADASETEPPPLTITHAALPVPAPPVTESAPAPADDDSLRLTMEVIGDSWVRLEADGKTVLNDELKRGDRRAFTANDRFTLRTVGNAAGVIITLNDTRLPMLGSEGEVVRNRVLDRETLVTASQNTEGSGREQ